MSEASIERPVDAGSVETVDELAAGHWVKVRGRPAEDGGFIAYKITLRQPGRPAAIEGSIDSVESQRQTIRVLDREVAIPAECEIRDRTGSSISLRELAKGTWVEIVGGYLGSRGFVPSIVEVRRRGQLEQLEGSIEGVDREQQTFELLGLRVVPTDATAVKDRRDPRRPEEKWDKWQRQVIPYSAHRMDAVIEPIRRAVAEGWFTPGMRVLDVGCGAGQFSAWLAERGFDVLGIDFSVPAIEHARRSYRNMAKLAFEVADVCRAVEFDHRFDALLDRGCLHGIDDELRRAYARSLATWAKPGARFLLLMRYRGKTHGDLADEVRALLAPEFQLVDHRPVGLERPDGKEVAGAALRLIRARG